MDGNHSKQPGDQTSRATPREYVYHVDRKNQKIIPKPATLKEDKVDNIEDKMKKGMGIVLAKMYQQYLTTSKAPTVDSLLDMCIATNFGLNADSKVEVAFYAPLSLKLCDQPPPEKPSTDKDWHLGVTNDLRNCLVGRVMAAICPSPDPHSINENGLKALIDHARKIERKMFESADDKEGYYHMLAEEIHEIQQYGSLSQGMQVNSNRTGGSKNVAQSDKPTNHGTGSLAGSEVPFYAPLLLKLCDQSPPEAPKTDKEWHLQVTKDLRNHLAGKLMTAICPTLDPHAIDENGLKELIGYVSKMERKIFETANDREEYYHTLAEKIYDIQVYEQLRQGMQAKSGKAVESEKLAQNGNESMSTNNGTDSLVSSGEAEGLPKEVAFCASSSSCDQPEKPNSDKEWHLLMTKGLRNHLVGKLIGQLMTELCPTSDPNSIDENGLKDLFGNAMCDEPDFQLERHQVIPYSYVMIRDNKVI